MRIAENTVYIEGTLLEIDLEKTQITQHSTGKLANCIRGRIMVRVNQPINGVDKTLDIPVHMFSMELKKDGGANPAYASIEKVMNEFKSAAAVGFENADKIRVTSGQINMNEFISGQGNLVSEPRVQANFVYKINEGSEFKPQAKFELEMYVQSCLPEMDKDNMPTGRQKITAIVPKFGGAVDVVPLYGVSPEVNNVITNYWVAGSTVKAIGRLDFSNTVETIAEKVGFGETIEKQKVTRVSDLIITGGDQTPAIGELAFVKADIDAAIQQRDAKLTEMRAKAESKGGTVTKQAPAQNAGFNARGF